MHVVPNRREPLTLDRAIGAEVTLRHVWRHGPRAAPPDSPGHDYARTLAATKLGELYGEAGALIVAERAEAVT